MQLNGRGKTPEEREKILRKLSGIKEPPKPKESKGKDKKVAKGGEKAHGHAPAGKAEAKLSAAKPVATAAAKTAEKPAAAKTKKKK
jgi:hypothetical protein